MISKGIFVFCDLMTSISRPPIKVFFIKHLKIYFSDKKKFGHFKDPVRFFLSPSLSGRSVKRWKSAPRAANRRKCAKIFDAPQKSCVASRQPVCPTCPGCLQSCPGGTNGKKVSGENGPMALGVILQASLAIEHKEDLTKLSFPSNSQNYFRHLSFRFRERLRFCWKMWWTLEKTWNDQLTNLWISYSHYMHACGCLIVILN